MRKTVTAVLVASLLVPFTVQSASAAAAVVRGPHGGGAVYRTGPGPYRGGYGGHGYHGHAPYYGPYRYGYGWGGWGIGFGTGAILGFGAGALLSAPYWTAPRYYYPYPVYTTPGYVYADPGYVQAYRYYYPYYPGYGYPSAPPPASGSVYPDPSTYPPPTPTTPTPEPTSPSAGAQAGQPPATGEGRQCQSVTVEGHYETRVLPGGQRATIWVPTHAQQVCQ